MADSKTVTALKQFPGLGLVNWRDISVPLAVLGVVIALITPLPRFVLDILIVTDVMMSVVVMMVAMYIRKPVEFSVFPTTLLLLTMFRLSLNISATRVTRWRSSLEICSREESPPATLATTALRRNRTIWRAK